TVHTPANNVGTRGRVDVAAIHPPQAWRPQRSLLSSCHASATVPAQLVARLLRRPVLSRTQSDAAAQRAAVSRTRRDPASWAAAPLEGANLMSRRLSGFKPTGHMHLGNYLGAIRPMVDGQRDAESIVFVADLHAMTIEHKPVDVYTRTLDNATLLLAA